MKSSTHTNLIPAFSYSGPNFTAFQYQNRLFHQRMLRFVQELYCISRLKTQLLTVKRISDATLPRAKPGNPINFRFAPIFFCILFPNFCSAQPNNSSSGNPCDADGVCGGFGICNPQKSPICSCLAGFYPSNLTEWDSGDWTGGCLRRVPLNCAGSNGTSGAGIKDGFLNLRRLFVPTSSKFPLPFQEGQCESGCLSICSCLAYGFIPGNICVLWTNGSLTDFQMVTNSSVGMDIYIRLANSELGVRKGLYKNIVISMVVVGLVLVLAVCLYITSRWNASKRGGNAYHVGSEEEEFSETGPSDSAHQCAVNQLHLEELPLFEFDTLESATEYFSEENKLGVGGFGPVYKGVLSNGREIAVKRLAKASGQGMQEFMNEVELISKLQHRNLVRLLGGCVEKKETLLIYEFMPNKSLDFFLFDQSQNILDWRMRFNIIEGICRGLLYLHRDSRFKIIHRDLKPSNILLDSDLNPKISDFGLARIFGTQQDHVSTVHVAGTFGYMAPEYAMKGRFSEKSDVFSLGVLIIEITTGIRNTSLQEESLNLVGHIWKLWNEDDVSRLIDKRIYSPSYQTEVVRCIHIGLLCVQELSGDRPSVSDVLSMLSNGATDLPKPNQPAFTVKLSRADRDVNPPQSGQNSGGSANDVAITIVQGR